MPESPDLLPADQNVAEQPASTEETRYRLRIEQPPAGGPRIRIESRTTGRVLLEWRGALARHLLQSGALPDTALRSADYACNKSLIRHLTLTCAAAKLALNRIAALEPVDDRRPSRPRLRSVNAAQGLSPTDRLIERLEVCRRRLPGPHLLVAKTLFKRQGEHFSESEVVCLMALEYPSMRTSLVNTCLDELTAWDVIQRIVIDDENVFYDIDMRPHLHIFDPATRSLRDAPQSGVLSIKAS